MKPMKTPEVSDKLDLYQLKDVSWFVSEVSALKNEGLYESLDWLTQNTGENVKKHFD